MDGRLASKTAAETKIRTLSCAMHCIYALHCAAPYRPAPPLGSSNTTASMLKTPFYKVVNMNQIQIQNTKYKHKYVLRPNLKGIKLAKKRNARGGGGEREFFDLHV